MLTVKGDSFYLDGAKFHIYSGAMHYFRIPHQYRKDRLQKLKAAGFTKGYVFVNGINLGRYWNVGPQRALYLPGVWLKDVNEIVVLELEQFQKPQLTITDKPSFR